MTKELRKKTLQENEFKAEMNGNRWRRAFYCGKLSYGMAHCYNIYMIFSIENYDNIIQYIIWIEVLEFIQLFKASYFYRSVFVFVSF